MSGSLDEHGNIALSIEYFLNYNFAHEVRILDIGTRFGSFLAELESYGYKDCYGVDIDDAAILRGKQAHESIANKLSSYDGEHLPFDDNSVDVVTMFDVIEHIPNVHLFLPEVSRVLRPKGVLMFQTPNILTNIPWEIVQHRSLTKWRTFHCSLQSLNSLKSLMLNAGFVDLVVEKNGLKSEYNLQRIKREIGAIGPPLINILEKLPLKLYPNFWGHCKNRILETE